MERATAALKRAQAQNFAPSKANQPSEGLSASCVNRLEQLMLSLRSYFAGQSIADETAEEYALEWADLVKKYGMERFEQAVVMARRYKLTSEGTTVPRQFFPLPSEIEQFITTHTDCPVIAVTEHDCPDCRGTGWKYIDTAHREKGAVRCHCRRLVKRA